MMQDLAVGSPQGLGQLWNRLILHLQVAQPSHGDESIRLHGHRLIELRTQIEVHIELVASMDLVPRIPLLELNVRHARTRNSRRCFRSNGDWRLVARLRKA